MCKRNIIITIVLTLLIFAADGFTAGRNQWYYVGNEEGCKQYASPVAGRDYMAAKTTCVIPARMEVVFMVIRDIASYPEWMENCTATKILKVVDDENDVFIFWFRQHVTFFKDRDAVIKSKTVIDLKNGRNIVYSDKTGEIAWNTGKGYVRMPSFGSSFTLEWVDREHTKVTFMIDPDLGKGLPVQAANIEIIKTTHKSLKKMMEMVKKSKYIEAAKTSKYNKYVEDGIRKGYLK
jgi:ribosome-associated toxin RatA of RatAB toxin-antitoxin module